MNEKIKKYLKHNHEKLAAYITAAVLLAGAIQYFIGWSYVLYLTPLILTLMTVGAVLYWPVDHKKKPYLVLMVLIVGVIAELIGVNTSLAFGNYSYGNYLGIKIFDTPLLSGVMWLLVVVSIWQIVLLSGFKKIYMVILAASLVVIFDLLLEQYAVIFGLWSWAGSDIPLKNYISWFFVSLIIFLVFAKYAKQRYVSVYGATVLPLVMAYFWLMLVIGPITQVY